MTNLQRVAIVAGEASGDILAAGLIRELKRRHPHLIIEGIAGPQMRAAGCRALFDIEDISVMLVTEIFKAIPRIVWIRYRLLQYLNQNKPDVYIGVDAPEFNLSIEKKLKRRGVKTLHYNSPKVWAWRSGRVKTIAKAVDMMLTLFPFEKKFYDDHHLPAKFVGHPLADHIPLDVDKLAARAALRLSPEQTVVAVLPGSRRQEITALTEVFMQTAALINEKHRNIVWLIPAINPQKKQLIERLVAPYRSQMTIQIIDGQSHQAMACADAILLSSGTATLEAMLHKRPMVVAYILSNISYWIGRMVAKVKYISLPNLLANKEIVPEFIQSRAKPELLAAALQQALKKSQENLDSLQAFEKIHLSLKQNASVKAADAVEGLCE